MALTWEVTMQEWIDAVSAKLTITPEPDVDSILETARDAARYVSGPAAAVTTYLLGYAAATGVDPDQAGRDVRQLAEEWAEQHSAT